MFFIVQAASKESSNFSREPRESREFFNGRRVDHFSDVAAVSLVVWAQPGLITLYKPHVMDEEKIPMID